MKPLKVLPDPRHVGGHPYHQHRFVVTDDCVLNVNECNEGDDQVECERGSVIATLTDCDGQAEYARLFAAAPQLMESLRRTARELAHWHEWATACQPDYRGSSGYHHTQSVLNDANQQLAIANGKGES